MRKAYINMKEKKIIGIYLAVVAILVAGAIFLFEAKLELFIGAICGAIVVMLNLWMLKKVMDILLKRPTLALALNLGRFIVYGLLIYTCYKYSVTAVIGLTLGVVGLPLAMIVFYSKGGTND